MIEIDDINREIANLEQNSMANFQTCEKLSVLYIIRDHMEHDDIPRYSFAPAPTEKKSEFLSAVYRDIDSALDIINDHMELIKVVYPKEYKLIMEKLNEI